MPTVAEIAAYLEEIAPLHLAEEWDNVGLLVGRRDAQVSRIMTCLTVTPESAAEAIDQRAELIVSHHPMPFRPLRQLTSDTIVGQILLDLISAGIAVYSAHTAFDSAAAGINQRLAEGLQFCDIVPLAPHPAGEGTGRCGRTARAISLNQLAEQLKTFLKIDRVAMVGEPTKPVSRVAITCGAADELFDAARAAGCEAVVIGEARFHTCLEAEAQGIGLLMPGHFASERFAVECLADALSQRFPAIQTWASRRERDPMR